jgi:hypothetical protein
MSNVVIPNAPSVALVLLLAAVIFGSLVLLLGMVSGRVGGRTVAVSISLIIVATVIGIVTSTHADHAYKDAVKAAFADQIGVTIPQDSEHPDTYLNLYFQQDTQTVPLTVDGETRTCVVKVVSEKNDRRELAVSCYLRDAVLLPPVK